MDLEIIISIATLVVIYIGGTILAVRHTTNVMSTTIVNTLGQRITDLRDDVKEIKTDIKSNNEKFYLHLAELHGSALTQRNGWKPYMQSM